ncbi:Phosphoribosylanthranilate isomerase (TrpF) (PDB:1DL3) [Commensalibacter communis]|uniref:phosphoribosylanthranilate isomerase n=1 Tax=Commensalibacter communis TaxID=2972786 RepID=UPI0022FFBDFB|nr:phosphoribosylanthranilate isomerase [Commensalibacter communis]CAI3948705.1 Phosphoribosylanthranilate isomerase (TrpF) (PDB:1DL3) [Commensalibacter communis]
MTAIKICGVKDPEIYELLATLKVNWVGLVFYESSPRFISIDQVRQLPDYYNEGISRVGLFVKPTLDEVKRVLETVRLDILQLYTTPEIARTIRETFDIPVWLAKGIQKRSDLPETCSIDGLVIEAPPNHSDSRPGGNGRTFDWQLTSAWNAPKPWLLAGGLTPENVVQAIQQSGAKAVDVSSGVERRKGEKDPTLIRQFIQNIRNIDFNQS